jgi:hypothetical protein
MCGAWAQVLVDIPYLAGSVVVAWEVTIPLLPLEPPPVRRIGRICVPGLSILCGVSFPLVRPQ